MKEWGFAGFKKVITFTLYLLDWLIDPSPQRSFLTSLIRIRSITKVIGIPIVLSAWLIGRIWVFARNGRKQRTFARFKSFMQGIFSLRAIHLLFSTFRKFLRFFIQAYPQYQLW